MIYPSTIFLLPIFLMASVNSYRRATLKASNGVSYTKLLHYAQNIHDMILANVAVFATPAVTMANFQTDITALGTALAVYTGKNTNRTSVTQLNAIKAAKLVVLQDLKTLAAYVNTIAVGDPAIVALSGFPNDNPRAPIGVFPPVTNYRQFISPKVATGDVKLRWKRPVGSKIQKASAYLVEGASDTSGANKIQIGIVTKTTITFTPASLQSGTAFVRVTPVNALFLSSSTSNTAAVGASSPWLKFSPQF